MKHLQLALLDTSIDSERNVGWDLLPESCDVLAVDRLRETNGSIDDIGVQTEEVLGDLRSTRVFRVERGNEHGRFTLGVELIMD